MNIFKNLKARSKFTSKSKKLHKINTKKIETHGGFGNSVKEKFKKYIH